MMVDRSDSNLVKKERTLRQAIRQGLYYGSAAFAGGLALSGQAVAQDQDTASLVDEAQLLDIKTLENLRLLSNLETRKHKLIYIIISGQPELENTLSHKGLSQLAQRIGLRCRAKPLAEKEAYEYIDQSFEEKDFRIHWMQSTPIFDPIKSDSRFRDIVKRSWK